MKVSLIAGLLSLFAPCHALLAQQVDDQTRAGLHFERRGSGPPLVIVHGFGTCAASLSGFMDSFSDSFTVIAPDLPGHGGSSRPSERFTYQQAGEAINRLLDTLGYSHVSAIGLSAGSIALLNAAVERPDRFDRLIAVSGATTFAPSARNVLQSTRSLADLPAPVSQAWADCAQTQEQLAWLLQQFAGFADHLAEFALSSDDWKAFTGRVLVIGGDRDPFFRPEELVALQGSVPNSALWIVPFGGHVPIFGERFPLFLAEARAFLAAP